MDPVVIQVNDIPEILSHHQMVDQLKIHFLKRSNNGGDVLMVIYPTFTSGQAYVVFESDHVPGVLEMKHFLETDGKFYPIKVKNSHLSKVDMQVQTTLNLEMFPEQDQIIDLATSHGFEVTTLKPGLLQLHGSFIQLKLLRGKLMSLQRDAPQISNGCSSALLNASSVTSQVKPRGSDPTPNPYYIKGNTHRSDQSVGGAASPYEELYSGGQSRLYSGHSPATKTRTSPSYAGIHHQPSSLPAYNDFSTTYQRDFSSLDPKSGLGYDTGNDKGASFGSPYRESPGRYSSTQLRSMSASASSSQMEPRFSNPTASRQPGESSRSHSSYSPLQHPSMSTSASQLEPRSFKITSRESERSRNHTESSTVNHIGESPTQHRSGVGSFGSPASRMAPRFSNPTSPTRSGSDESSRSREHTPRREGRANPDSRRRRSHVDDASSLSDEYPPAQQRSAFQKSHLSSGDDSFSSAPSTGRMSSFPVDTDTLNYILTQDPETIRRIGETYGTEMSLQDDAEFTTVTFKGRDCEHAKCDLLGFMNTISLELRTQVIDLGQYDRAHQVQIVQRIEHFEEPGVLIKRHHDSVKIVGSSRRSFEIKQKLIGEDDERPRGRSSEKSSRSRRSSSVPKQLKIQDRQRRSSSPEARTSAGQDAQDLRRSPNRTTKDLQRRPSEDLPASNEDKKFCPKILKMLGTDFDFKKRLQRK